ncbi:MAG TPA: bifunctional 5,10-methylenetetrahydrofolate dehydrogenase/5,10-methenyltetrahydrofolate cyclohydrolase [Thermoplasmata archaeon]|nr:bifunctional 5,10-methylenetetrahydrofolate dehydrogenase/5,10-methenyltetrahydrofolate cyclohydrolase [Thermoplasmata archaeon]
MTERLEGKPVAETLDRATRAAIAALPTGGGPPTLASLHRDVESPFRFYLRRQEAAAARLGIRFVSTSLRADEGPAGLGRALATLDRDPSVHAVLVEHPLPAPYDFSGALAALRPEKDVDGVGPINLGRLVGGRAVHVPAVAKAALDIARHYALPIEGERVVVIGRSETVGLPLALLLTARAPGPSATVTVAHSRTRDLAAVLAGARTIFSCAGQPGLLHRRNVPEGAAIVDVGLSSVPDPSKPSGARAVGDADPDSLDGWAGALTPVPGGVGPVTVAELMAETVRSRSLLTSPGGSA